MKTKLQKGDKVRFISNTERGQLHKGVVYTCQTGEYERFKTNIVNLTTLAGNIPVDELEKLC